MKSARLKFPIELDIAGGRMTFVGCDMLVGWFFQGFPDPMPLTDCWKREGEAKQRDLALAQEAWHDEILCRGVWLVEEAAAGPVCKRLTPELVQRLGDQRDRAVIAYLSGIGWLRPEDKGYLAPTGALPRRLPRLDDPYAATERRAAMTRIPSRNLLMHIKQVATAGSTASHVIWRRWWISEFLWSWRAQEVERGERQAPAGPRGVPDDFAAIGVEA